MTHDELRWLALWPRDLPYLGGGGFGSAYLLPDGNVLKVGTCTDGTAAWIEHAARVYRETGKPALYAPKVFAFGRIKSGWWACMEWVTPEHRRTGRYSWDVKMPATMRNFIASWGDSRGLERHDDEYSYPDAHGGNWGRTRDGRAVAFDPFAGVQLMELLEIPAIPPGMRHRSVFGKGPTAGRWARG